jgi:hypothetical protein
MAEDAVERFSRDGILQVSNLLSFRLVVVKLAGVKNRRIMPDPAGRTK